MFFDFGQLILVKRYLWLCLAIAIFPLLIIAALYDHHSSNLTDRLLLERIESDLETTILKTNSFIDIQKKRLENIADLPEIISIFDNSFDHEFSSILLDLIYFEIEDPDIYGLFFYDTKGTFIRSFPSWPSQFEKNTVNLNDINDDDNQAKTIQLALPKIGYPGWFLMKKTVFRNSDVIGIIGLKIRLASMTEQAASLYLRGVYEPLFFTPKNGALSVIAHIKEPTTILAQSENFLPGWSIALQSSGEITNESNIRVWLLLVVIASALGIIWLYLHMSLRLAQMIIPLTNGAKAIANGDLTTLVPENGFGELGTLARAFNDMSKQLSKMITTRVYAEHQASLGKLATGIAHEIRNPLAIIRTTVHGLIASEKNLQNKEMLKIINDEVLRTDNIVKEFMNYACPRAPHKELISIEDALHKVSLLISASALSQDVEVSKLGELSLMVYLDPGQFSQILMNLTLNALQSMPNGGYLYLRSHRKKDRAHLAITDTGSGILKHELTEIKVPFFSKKIGGTGLGLSICTQLIHANDGTLDIESVEGEGTTVTITFPLNKKTG
jgi:two-component system sensor histidine kinase AtoS